MTFLLPIPIFTPIAFARTKDAFILWRISQSRTEMTPLCEPNFQYFSRDDSFRPPYVRH